jgi:hypothetical protein
MKAASDIDADEVGNRLRANEQVERFCVGFVGCGDGGRAAAAGHFRSRGHVVSLH